MREKSAGVSASTGTIWAGRDNRVGKERPPAEILPCSGKFFFALSTGGQQGRGCCPRCGVADEIFCSWRCRGDEIIGVSFFPMATIAGSGRLEGLPVGVMLRVWKSTGEVYCQRIVLQR